LQLSYDRKAVADIIESDLQDDDLEIAQQTVANDLPDETDYLLIKEIYNLMTEEKLYREPDLSVEILSQRLNAKRHYVSAAINHCTNKSFNVFINDYRIKEAIQLLSQKDGRRDKLTVDDVAFSVGFNDRYIFHRVFKSITGLTPAAFRKNANT
jgi:AraC-like DNA-binding protein